MEYGGFHWFQIAQIRACLFTLGHTCSIVWRVPIAGFVVAASGQSLVFGHTWTLREKILLLVPVNHFILLVKVTLIIKTSWPKSKIF